MPMHDWTRVEAGIYHDFHHEWISQVKRAVNARLPADYYALAEQHAAGFGPDVLTLQSDQPDTTAGTGGTATLTRRTPKLFQEAPAEFYQRKQKSVVIRHVSGDRIVAVIEVVSPGNKNSAHGLRAFVRKARELLHQKIHLSIIDPFPIGDRDPQGLHALIFDDFVSDPLSQPAETPLCLISYECADSLRAYLEPFAVGDVLTDMRVYLAPEWPIEVPLEATYLAAWDAVPARWQRVIAAPVDSA